MLDNEALYSFIPHERGPQIIENVLNNRAMSKHKHGDFLIKLLRILLTHNKFQFNGKFYRQAQGTAKGTKCAPANANLYLGNW